MLGVWGYRVLVVSLVIVSFLAFSSGIRYTGQLTGDPESGDFVPLSSYNCPEQECPESPDSEEAEKRMEDCKEALRKYGEMVEEIGKEKEILEQRVISFLGEACEIGKGSDSMEDAGDVADPESVRDFAVFIVSNSGKDPVTSLYEYVRMNVMCVGDPDEEYVASPCETILLGGGDCEDHSVLLASLMEAVGIESRIIWIPGEHAFVGISAEGMEIGGVCGNPLWFRDERGKNLLLADTSFSSCIGRVNEDYITEEDSGWDWKKNPLILDV